MFYKFKDNRGLNIEGERVDKTQFAGRLKPGVIASIMRTCVYPNVCVPSVIDVTLEEDGYVASKIYVRGMFDTHIETLKFTDFDVEGGPVAESVKKYYEKSKKMEFGIKYVIAKEQQEEAERSL